MSRFWSLILIACGTAEDPTSKDDTPPDDADADADTDADTDTDTDTDLPCVAVVTAVDAVVAPSPELTPGTFDIDLTATFDLPVAETHDFAIEVDGAAGTTALASDGLSMVWEGTVESDQTFDVTATVCGVDTTSEFTTPDLGIQGSTFALVWDDLVVVEPANASLLGTLIDGPRFLLAQSLAIDAVSGLGAARVSIANTLDAFGAPEPNCMLAAPADVDFTQDPELTIGSALLTVPIDPAGGTAQVEAFTLVGRVSADESRLVDVRIEGLIATEQVSPGDDCNSALIGFLDPTACRAPSPRPGSACSTRRRSPRPWWSTPTSPAPVRRRIRADSSTTRSIASGTRWSR